MEKLLEIKNITKVFPGTVALDDFSVKFEAGKVHAFLGKNGSGKSTLIKIIAGAQPPTSGEILLDGKKLVLKNPQDAFDKGIATVYQELSLIPGLSIAENIFFGRLPKKGPFIDYNKANQDAAKLLEELEINISPKVKVSSLNIWQRQLIEIAKAMSNNPHVLLLDEPTSALAQHETEMLFKLVRALKEKGVIILYITHKLQELWSIADTVTVLRDGKFIGREELADLTKEKVIKMMFGDIETKTIPEELKCQDEVVLEVEGLTRKDAFCDVSFKLRKGEVLGIAGLLGSGRSELLRAIFGSDKYDSGKVLVSNKPLKKGSPNAGKQAGLAMTSENRKEEGLIQIHSVRENLVLASLKKVCSNGVFSKKKERSLVDKQVDGLQIKIANAEVPVSSLSGGNQQKVVVGNWLNTDPKVILLDEPSKGIDVNAKQQIFDIVWEQSRHGIASIIVSSELEELIQTCHRVLIMSDGMIRGELLPSEVTVEELYTKCMGE